MLLSSSRLPYNRLKACYNNTAFPAAATPWLAHQRPSFQLRNHPQISATKFPDETRKLNSCNRFGYGQRRVYVLIDFGCPLV